MRKRSSIILAVLVFLEVATLAVIYYYIPHIRRPFELMMGLIAGFSLLELLAARGNAGRSVALALFSVSGTVFALEMAQKYWDILSFFEREPRVYLVPNKGELAWDPGDGRTYLASRARARELGWEPAEAFATHFAGDIFAGMDKAKLEVRSSDNWGYFMSDVSLKPFRIFAPPLGFELAPDNVARTYFVEKSSGETLFDAKITSGSAGERVTKGTPGADAAYIFMGCSFTFGYGLSDDQTQAYFFSEAGGFKDNVINIAFNGYGPHIALRDLELDYHMGKTGIDPKTVKGVIYGLLDGHIYRVANSRLLAPWYELGADGRPEFKGTFQDRMERTEFARFFMMMNSSRIYPVIRQKLQMQEIAKAGAENWRLTYAILREMDRLCREKYGVGLTILYWNDTPEVIKTLQESGIRVLLVSDALGKDWNSRAVLYLLHDEHPNAYINKLLGRYVREAMMRK